MEPIFVQGQFPITLTTSDPSKALISTSLQQHGQASVTLTGSGSAWLEVVDTSGPISITASGPGSDPVTLGLRLGELVAEFFNFSQPITETTVVPGQTLNTVVRVFVSPLDPQTNYASGFYVRPDATPIRLRVQSSDASIASAALILAPVGPGATFYDSPVTIQAHSVGDAVVSIQVDSGAIRNPVPLTVHVQPQKIVMKPLTLGYNMAVSLPVTLQGQSSPGTTQITLTSSDPSRLLLSLDAQTPGQPSVTLSTPYTNNNVYAQALASTGSVDVTATAAGYASGKSTVTLVPSGFAWSPSYVDITNVPGQGRPPNPVVAPYAIDPSNGTAFLRQALRPGLDGKIMLQNSNPDAVTLAQDTISLSAFSAGDPFSGAGFGVALTQANGGDSQISITQPPGFVAPVGRGPLRAKAPHPSLKVSPQSVGRNMQGIISVSLANAAPSSSPSPQITLASGDPSKLLISNNNLDLGSASVAVGGGSNLYLNALDGPVDVKVTATAPGFESGSAIVSIIPSAILFSPGYSGQAGDLTVQTNTQIDNVQLAINVASPDAQYVGAPYDTSTLRPGLDPIQVTINSSNAAVAAVPEPPVLNSLTSQAKFQIKSLAAGDAQLTIVPPPGFVLPRPGKGRTVKVSVSGPSFSLTNVTLGRDLQTAATLSVQSGAPRIPNDVNVTLTSSDPSKVVLSADSVTPGSGSLTIPFFAGLASSRSIYVQALDQSGTVSIMIAAPGYGSTSAQVMLFPTSFRADQMNVNLSAPSNPYQLPLRPVPLVDPPVSYVNSTYQLRAGMSGITIGVSSSAPAVVSAPSQITASAGAREVDVPITPLSPGSATLSFNFPDPYVAPGNVSVQVQGGSLFLSPSSPVLGKNLQTSMGVSAQSGNGVALTITSSDPARLLVSTSASSLGQASVVATFFAGTPFNVYLQALSDTGTVTVMVAATGYQTVSATVQLTSPAVILGNMPTQIGTLTTLSPPVSLEAHLTNGSNPNSYNALTLRPGAPAAIVPIALSDPTIGSLTPAQLVFNPGDSSKTFSFQPLAPGSALLSLGVPAGYADPLSLRQQLINVLAPRLNFSATLSVGKDLQRSFTVGLLSVPAQPLTLTLTSADPARLLLSTGAAGNPVSSLTLSFANSQSSQFNLVGLAGSGTVALRMTSSALIPSSYDVSLQPSGFVFSSPQTSTTTGSILRIPVFSYALNSQTLAPDANYPLRPGISPVAITIASSDGSVLPSEQPLFFYPGDSQQFSSITAKAPGAATLTIRAPEGFSTPSNGATATVRVQ
jgi:hypothetical protein